jgi:amino-acid N-acetyltransferase
MGLTDEQDLILSILQAHPSARDSRSYLSSFAPSPPPQSLTGSPKTPDPLPQTAAATKANPLVSDILNPILRRPALVKIQGPFTDTQLNSISRGMAYLQRMGLVPVIVVDRDDIPSSEPGDNVAAQKQRTLVMRDMERVVYYLSRARAGARPVLSTVARLGEQGEVYVEEEGLDHVRRAVDEGEIPVLLPVALDEGCRSRRISSDKVLIALSEAMCSGAASSSITNDTPRRGIDLTPLRLLIINREGGVPSYARSGLPHLLINLSSEYEYITSTFRPEWRHTHPTALANLQLVDACLSFMPPNASGLVVSHRSPAALIANLITNKPAHSASLPHALLESEEKLNRDTPTVLRKGLPVKVLRSMDQVDKIKLTALLESSFRRKLNEESFYSRLEKDLDFVIVIGDYAGAAITTIEGRNSSNPSAHLPICYLDKFAVDPSHQGDGTVDFLWVSLRDETYGLGTPDASNPSEGSLRGIGKSRELVWRSRGNNPVNKWYFERSSGFVSADGGWKVFWCDREERRRAGVEDDEREFGGGWLSRIIEGEEKGRLMDWVPVVESIPSAWHPVEK